MVHARSATNGPPLSSTSDQPPALALRAPAPCERRPSARGDARQGSAPRAVFSGDTACSRSTCPPAPASSIRARRIDALKDVDAAIRYAINHPLGSDPLHAKLRPGMKVVIAIDDISLPLPPMRRPDVRERVLTIVLELLADHGVEDVEIIIATAIHRRMTAEEVRHVVGDRIFDAYWPDRLYNHDAEDPQRDEASSARPITARWSRSIASARRERPRSST